MVAGVAEAAVSYEASQEALEEQQEMLKTQNLESSYKTLVRKNQTLDQMQLALQTNEAHAAVSGATMNSPSFFAKNADVIQQGKHALRNASNAEALNDYALQMKERNAQTQADLQKSSAIFSGITSVTESIKDAWGMPVGGRQQRQY